MQPGRQPLREPAPDVAVGEADAAALGERLRRLAWAQVGLNLALARHLGLGSNDVWALEHLLLDGPLGPVELGHRLGITPASSTTLVDRLEMAGHVERRPHPSDRRRQAVVPTEHAQAAAYRAIAPLAAELDAAAAELSPAERAAVGRYLGRVTAAIRAFAVGDAPRREDPQRALAAEEA